MPISHKYQEITGYFLKDMSNKTITWLPEKFSAQERITSYGVRSVSEMFFGAWEIVLPNTANQQQWLVSDCVWQDMETVWINLKHDI